MSKSIGCGILLVLVLIVLAIGGMLWTSYNRLVTIDQRVNTAWANVQTQYQRRFDLIPNLVNTVAGAANFEKSTLEAVTNARASVGRVQLDPTKAPTDAAQMDNFKLPKANLVLPCRDYWLSQKTIRNFAQHRISANCRRRSRAQKTGLAHRVRTTTKLCKLYNTMVRRFPTVMIAGMLGFHPRPPFTSQSGAEKAPAVNFNFGNTTPTPAPAATP